MWNAWPVDVRIHQSDFGTEASQRQRQRGCDRAFANATFAAADGNHTFGTQSDLTQTRGWALMIGELNIDLCPRRCGSDSR